MATKKKGDAENPNENDSENQTSEQQQKPARKPREAKVKHAAGSPHAVLTDFINSLTPTQADYLNRHVIRKNLNGETTGMSEFEAEIYNGIKEKLA